jgi:hypothetical protein
MAGDVHDAALTFPAYPEIASQGGEIWASYLLAF